MANSHGVFSVQTWFCLLLPVILLWSCEEDDRLKIPVPEKGVSVSIERLDQQWFEMSAVTFRKMHPQWRKSYGELYTRYVEDVLHLGSINDSTLFDQIRNFTTDPAIAEVQDSVLASYADLSFLEEQLTVAWSYYLHYFPEQEVPEHVSFIGGFNTPAALTENGVGIGLEMFLGSSCKFYEYLQLPVYLRSRMTKEHIVPTIIKGWLKTEYPLQKTSPTLLEVIINQGKVLYAMDAILPYTHDSLKIFYSGTQVQWAQEHQPYVWAHFIDHELLFSTNTTEIAKFTNDGPFTVDLVKESPSRMGYFIGWQIVRNYMDQQDSIDLPGLMLTDPQRILEESKYKP